MGEVFVVSLGGSLVVPSGIDVDFLCDFRKHVEEFLDRSGARIVFVVGGGATARLYQSAMRSVNPGISSDALDMIGIRATRMNALVVKELFGCQDDVVEDPNAPDVSFFGKVLVAAGWKPGFSTDMDAVVLAKRFGAKVCINLSNIDRVYTADPKKDPEAKPLDDISWNDFISDIVGTKWIPGSNYPFDPIASQFARDNGLTVICANGGRIGNTISILEGKPFVGTRMHP